MSVVAGRSSRADRARDGTRTLVGTGVNHALHDGYTELIYVLLPIWQAEFGLGYAALALVRALYVSVLALLQVPSGRLAELIGIRTVLVAGTLLSATGYGLAGASGGLLGLCAGLALAGAGGATQHPLASAAVARAFGTGARGPLGTYNFAGDLGKAGLPPLVAGLLLVVDWRVALWCVAGLGAATALVVALLLPALDRPGLPGAARHEEPAEENAPGRGSRTGFGLLVLIGALDNAARPAFLLYLPFLLRQKGAELTTVGVALALVAVGGAFGKAVCGRLGARLGVTRTVVLTEAGTATAILAAIALPLGPILVLLPLLGTMLNGTSSVLYGTVPDLAPDGRVERAFAVFYTVTLGSSALAMPLFYGRLGDAVGPSWAAVASAATALAAVPAVLALAYHQRSGSKPAGS